MVDPIKGGFFILARAILTSDLMDKPPLHMKLWVWMLGQAMWKDGKLLKRGQLLTTIDTMREAMSYRIGFRKVTPTKDEIRSAYEGFVKAAMITTAKTTRGMVVTVLNYDLYQNAASYEAHSDAHNEDAAKPTVTPHHREERGKKEKKEETTTLKAAKRESDTLFDEFWQAYPKKVAEEAARAAWANRKVDPALLAEMLQAIEWQRETEDWEKENGRFIPNPAKWLDDGRWKDEKVAPPKYSYPPGHAFHGMSF